LAKLFITEAVIKCFRSYIAGTMQTASGSLITMARVTRDEALRIARAETERRGWPWCEPVSVNRSLLTFHVMTNAQMRGGNVNVHVRIRDGSIRRIGFARR
jgi:hypothetical protein